MATIGEGRFYCGGASIGEVPMLGYVQAVSPPGRIVTTIARDRTVTTIARDRTVIAVVRSCLDWAFRILLLPARFMRARSVLAVTHD